jgi:hypothetical protein
MPESVEEVAVQTAKDGNYGYIIFAPLDSLAESMKKMDVQVVFEYDEGFMKVGMGEAYTLKMLTDEFWYLTRESWGIFPTLPIKRNDDGSVVHGVTENWTETSALLQRQKKLHLPPKIIEDRGRGTLIRNVTSQGKPLQYWARIQQNIEVGIFIPEESKNVEYWMNLTIQFEPNAKPEDYPRFLMEMCWQRTRLISNGVAQWLEEVKDFVVQTRYAFNSVRVWYCPNVSTAGLKIFGSRIERPMAEDNCPKDKWYAWSGVMAYTFPLTDIAPIAVLQERYDDEEVQVGKIAPIAAKQTSAQKPPNGLDRMQSTFSKQVAYDQRILEAESEIAGINCEIPHFLEDMTLEEPVYVCINSSEEMDRNEQSIAGQLWIQGDRHMTASNVVPDGMADTKDSAHLAAAAEPVSWNHASQPDHPRKCQRVIIYPRELTQLEDFLSTGDPNVDPEDGHPLAYATIL